MKRASLSRTIILGVVPDATSAWKPLIAPQAIVMNANGNSLPAKTGPVPSMNGVSGGHPERRQRDEDAEREQEDRPDLHEGREVVARAEQHPDRQHARR